MLFVAFTFVMNDLVIKHIVRQPRPERSCLTSCGMPSSHSAISIGFYVYMLLDFAARVRCGGESLLVLPGTLQSHSPSNSLWLSMVKVCRTPWPAWEVLKPLQLAAVLTFWSVVFIPVPISRVQLGDHYWQQVLVGGAVGGCTASFWWLIVRKLQHTHNHRLGDVLLGRPGLPLLRHNASLPYPIVERRCADSSIRNCDSRLGADCCNCCANLLEWYMTQVAKSWLSTSCMI
ncbi:unnamed protein product [Polarella glacialis]|uniref:Phosphatidic acid phosphatase type 2/haloperoxidase domain-containing protein n=1 Tax=Polarella glacialis TaxID=89957 RepID=A0A813LQ38_POLGL|nr:unnamed protein product [Polarella glacialis]